MAITINTGEIFVKIPSKIVAKTIIKQIRSMTDPFHNLITAFKTNTQTATRIQLNACWTIGISAKLCKNEASIIIMTKDGKTTPEVATRAPIIP